MKFNERINFRHVIRGEKLEHLVSTGLIKGKCSSGKQHEMLDGLTKWLKVRQVTDALKVTRDIDAWKIMVIFTNEQGT